MQPAALLHISLIFSLSFDFGINKEKRRGENRKKNSIRFFTISWYKKVIPSEYSIIEKNLFFTCPFLYFSSFKKGVSSIPLAPACPSPPPFIGIQ